MSYADGWAALNLEMLVRVLATAVMSVVLLNPPKIVLNFDPMEVYGTKDKKNLFAGLSHTAAMPVSNPPMPLI